MQADFQFVQLSKQIVFPEQNNLSQTLAQSKIILKGQSLKDFEKTCKLRLFNCKKLIFSIIQDFNLQVKESLSRMLINKFLVFKKSFSQILEEGILTLYIQLFQIRQNLIKNGRRQTEKEMLSLMIQAIQPLLFEHFIFKDFQRRKKIILQFQQCQLKTKPLLKKMSKISDLSSQSSQKDYQQLNLAQQDQNLIKIIKEEFKDKCLNDLLAQYLKSQSENIDQMMELCRICSKSIRLVDLQKHVIYCQKKVILKQQINKYSKKLEEILLELKNQTENLQNKFSQPKRIERLIQKLSIFHKKFDKKKKEKHWQSLYRINQGPQSNSLIEIQEDLTAYEMEYGSLNIIEGINTYLVVERDIGLLCKELSQLQQCYKTFKSIKSSTTLRQNSQNSNNLNSKCQKKSKFAKEGKFSTKSINSIKIQRVGSNQNQTSDRSFEMINQEGFANNNLKTKKSLGTPKIVHFNFQDCDQIKSQSQSVQDDGSKKFKSLYNFQSILNFDDLDESSSQEKEIHQLSLEDFQIIKYIGKGAFGKVYAARRKSTQDLYALKIVNIDQKWGQKELASIINEHQVFKKIEGDHLVRAPFSFGEGSTQIFMMEFMPGGDLSKLLQEQCYFQQSKAKFYLAQIVLALQHLHKAQIIHRDLKPQNLVLDQGGHLKLTDFGLSQFQIKGKLQKVFKIYSNEEFKAVRRRQRRTAVFPNRSQAKLIGTPDYIAPQIINGISVDNKSIDWWSLGVIAYQLMVGARPFCGNSIEQVVGNIIRYQIEWPQIGTQEGCISENAYDLISKLLNRDFINRIGAQDVQQIKNHPFFGGTDWQNIKYTKAPYIPPEDTMKKLLQMKEDTLLKQQIELMIRANNKNSKLKLQNFVRYDILGQQTVDSAKKSRSLKGNKLKKLEDIKESITNQILDHELQMIPGVRKIKKHKSYFQIHSRQDFDLNE